MDLDQYLRAGLHEQVAAVIHTAQRWHESPSSITRMDSMNAAIEALADAYVAFNDAVEEFKDGPDEPSEIPCVKDRKNRR